LEPSSRNGQQASSSLTATRSNLHQQDLLNLLELLAPEDFGDLEDLALRLEPNKIINAVAAGLAEASASGHAMNAQLGRLGTTALGQALTKRPEFVLLTELLSRDELTPPRHRPGQAIPSRPEHVVDRHHSHQEG